MGICFWDNGLSWQRSLCVYKVVFCDVAKAYLSVSEHLIYGKIISRNTTKHTHQHFQYLLIDFQVKSDIFYRKCIKFSVFFWHTAKLTQTVVDSLKWPWTVAFAAHHSSQLMSNVDSRANSGLDSRWQVVWESFERRIAMRVQPQAAVMPDPFGGWDVLWRIFKPSSPVLAHTAILHHCCWLLGIFMFLHMVAECTSCSN